MNTISHIECLLFQFDQSNLPSFDSIDSGPYFIEIVVTHVIVHLLVVFENRCLRVSVGNGAEAEWRLVTLWADKLSTMEYRW